MRKIFFLVGLISLLSCSKVPVTGRKQLNLLPEGIMMATSLESYNEFLSKNKSKTLPPSNGNAAMVLKVGRNIAAAVTKYMKQKGLSKRIKGYKWEFNLVDDKTVNAWCMPGGKVVVYSGLLPVSQDEEGLAVVMVMKLRMQLHDMEMNV